jgi:CRISPR/Cas system-associated endonuclease Cas3-HD
MKQKTAVTQLIERLKNDLNIVLSDNVVEFYLKEEKEQIEKAVVFGNRQDFYDGTEEIGDNYFNSTYTQSSE